MYSPPPTLSNPNGTRGLLCSSTVGPIAWWGGNGATIFDTNRNNRLIYQIIPSENLTAQIVRDGRTQDISGSPQFDYHNGLFTCRRDGDISTAVPVGFYMRDGRTGELICIYNKVHVNEKMKCLLHSLHTSELAEKFYYMCMYVLMLEFLCVVSTHALTP